MAVDSNMGAMRYAVSIDVPEGYPGLTPSVELSYSTGSGGSVAGMGWTLPMPSVERLTARGLPEYDLDDEFAADGSDQLVRIPDTDPPVYRSRFEKGFVRYTWVSAGDGTEGYWTGEYPDGRIGYFGASPDGTLAPAARVSNAMGTFRYHLVEMVDRYGHAIRYDYSTFGGNYALMQRIGWAHAANGDPTYFVTFAYEDREDLLSDCKPGFNEVLEKRLWRINVFAHDQRLSYYELQYESYAESGGSTRLAGVQRYGLDGSAYPVQECFEYSKALGAMCTGEDCQRPYTVAMGSLGVDLHNGDATLIDINGDALPDVIDTSVAGQPHRFFLNVITDNGDGTFSQGFQTPALESAVGAQDSHDLSSPYCQVMDVDGDGFTDLVNAQTGEVLLNLGGGDWASVYSLWTSGDGGAPDLNGDFDPSDGELRTIRFLDYDNDKRIDLIRSVGADASNTTTIYRNIGDGGFQSDPTVAALGAGFESDNLELNDMNGDGLLDAVQVTLDAVRYRLNLGRGQWGAWVEVTGFTFTDQEKIEAELEDLNGDALADLVLVAGDAVRYWLNRNGQSFDSERVVTSDDIDGVIPVRDASITVLYADMNGNGTSDILWVTGSGAATYLELFPVRPNLMSRIENGLGKVTAIIYGTSVEHQARDGGRSAWAHPLPHPMNVVDRYDEWDELADLHEIIEYAYHDGFYDGVEKQFRGFARVEQLEPGDATGEEALTLMAYDLGAGDPYRSGLLLTEELLGDAGRSLRYETRSYDDCTVSGIPASGLLFPVRHLCLVEETAELREGRPASEWVTERRDLAYDGYGNVAYEAANGLVAVGAGVCEPCAGIAGRPCGAECLGDEAFTRTEYTRPEDNDGRWLLDRPVRVRRFGTADAVGEPASQVYTEELTFYDGEDFVGLVQGQITHGGVTRVVRRVTSAGEVVEAQRNRLDDHGNVIETLDPLATLDGMTHRRTYTYDPQGLRLTAMDVLLEDDQGLYTLHQELQYDPIWDAPVEATAFMVVRGGTTIDARHSTFWAYDAFGRTVSMTQPGEGTSAAATEEYTYDIGSPSSRIVSRSRSRAGGALDIEKVQCFDGHGRGYQERVLIAGDQYKVSGFTVFNVKGEPQVVYQPYIATGAQCDLTPPAGVLFTETNFDAAGRPVRQLWPDADTSDGEPDETRTEYGPLIEVVYDLEDTYQQGEHTDTPTVRRFNGRGEMIEVVRYATAGEALEHRFVYDELGRLSGWIDPAGNRRVQEYDLVDQVTRVDDPDRGVSLYTYDAAGNPVQEVDARGVVTRRLFDGDNRVLATWKGGDETSTRIDYHYDTVGHCPSAQCSQPAGRLAWVRYPLDGGQVGEDRHGYDRRGRGVFFGRRLDGHLFTIQSEYDNADRPLANTYPGGIRFDFVHDGASRLQQVPGHIERITYDERGQVEDLELANGVTVTRAYDARLRLRSLTSTGPGGAALQAYTYQRNRMGRITEVQDGRATDAGPLANARYHYDALYRLVQAELEPDDAGYAETLAYAFDAIGNLTTKTSSRSGESAAHVGSYVYGEGSAGPHAVTTAGNRTFAYDAAGYMTARGAAEYEWDFFGRLTRAYDADGELAAFVYDAADQRVIKREDGHTTYYISHDFEVRGGVATAFLTVDENRVVKVEEPSFAASLLSDVAPTSGSDMALSADPDGAITAADAWIAQAIGAGTLAFSNPTAVSPVTELLEASVRRILGSDARRVRYLHHDHQGGVVAVTDGSGALVERTEYYPYGEIRYETSGGEPYGYTGKERDRSTGLVYFGGRYLDPWSGRWTAPDPLFDVLEDDAIGDPDESTGGYPYGRGDPVNSVDDDGRFVWVVIGGIVGAVTATVAEVMVQKAKMKKGMQQKISWGKVIGMALLGGATGALTGGLAAGWAATALTGAKATLALTGIGISAGADLISGGAEAIGIRTSSKISSHSESAKRGARWGSRIALGIGAVASVVKGVIVGPLAGIGKGVSSLVIYASRSSERKTGKGLPSMTGDRLKQSKAGKGLKSWKHRRDLKKLHRHKAGGKTHSKELRKAVAKHKS